MTARGSRRRRSSLSDDRARLTRDRKGACCGGRLPPGLSASGPPFGADFDSQPQLVFFGDFCCGVRVSLLRTLNLPLHFVISDDFCCGVRIPLLQAMIRLLHFVISDVFCCGVRNSLQQPLLHSLCFVISCDI